MATVQTAFSTVLPSTTTNCSAWSKYKKPTHDGWEIGCLLTTVCANVVRFYDVCSPSDSSSSPSDSPDLSTSKLVLRSEHALSGNIVSIHPLNPISSASADVSSDVSLLVAFSGRENQVSLVTLDSTTGSLNGTSVASFYQTLRDTSMGMESCFDNELIVDVNESNTCFVACLGGGCSIVACNIALQNKKYRVDKNSFTVDLKQLATRWVEEEKQKELDANGRGKIDAEKKRVGNKGKSILSTGFGDIVGVKFLAGYLEPTIAILHHPKGRTWQGQAGERRCPMSVTVVTLGVEQKRSVVVWRNSVLPNDTQYIIPVPQTVGAVIAVAVNSVHYLSPGGVITASLATNGYAHDALAGPELWPTKFMKHPAYSGSKTSSISNSPLATNPRPLQKLKARLDGSHLAFVDGFCAICVLRSGDVYSLQVHDQGRILSMSPTAFKTPPPSLIEILPIARNLNVTNHGINMTLEHYQPESTKATPDVNLSSVGLMFVGSKLGDSSLVVYGQTLIDLDAQKAKRKREENDLPSSSSSSNPNNKNNSNSNSTPPLLLSPEEDNLLASLTSPTLHKELLKEEESLYSDAKPSTTTTQFAPPPPPLAPDSSSAFASAIRPTIDSFFTYKFQINDSLIQTGPLGKSVLGPTVNSASVWKGKLASERIFCSGYGREGGLSILSTPGSSSSTSILADIDVSNVDDVYILPSSSLLLLSRRDKGFLLLQSSSSKDSDSPPSLSETDTSTLFSSALPFSAADDVLLTATDANLTATKNYAFLAVKISKTDKTSIFAFSVDSKSKKLKLEATQALPQTPKQLSLTPDPHHHCLGVAALFDDGTVTAYKVEAKKSKVTFSALKLPSVPTTTTTTTAINLFLQNDTLFEESSSDGGTTATTTPSSAPNAIIDDDDLDHIYRQSTDNAESDNLMDPSNVAAYSLSSVGISDVNPAHSNLYLSTTSSSGSLSIYDLSSPSSPVFHTEQNLAFSPSLLTPSSTPTPATRNNTSATVTELNFFIAGANIGYSEMRSLYVIVRTSLNDVFLYAGRKKPGKDVVFAKCNFSTVIRPVNDAKIHASLNCAPFERPKFKPFKNISGHSGLFAALARPFWVLNERGGANVLPQKIRFADHACAYPIASFAECSFLSSPSSLSSSFITLNERVGGSQRFSIINGLDEVLTGCGFISTGGVHVQKIPLNVTVRDIEYLDHSASTNERPLYALLVEVEEEVDMSGHDDDGFTDLERYEHRKDKNFRRMEDVIDSDLRGHEDEFQDWADTIQRTDYLEINMDLGRCPNQTETKHEIWLVEAKNWSVLNKFSMNKDEYCTTIKFLHLTEDETEQERAERYAQGDYAPLTRTFLAVGTSQVDSDGDETPAIGRILLYNVVETKTKKDKEEKGEKGENVEEDKGLEDNIAASTVHLSLAHEKESRLGPVSAMNSLDCGSNIYLVVGAGSQVSLEAWKDDTLTQVGFYHAMQHVISIEVIRSYIVLVDAYEGIRFLIWKDGDKTLNLIARDYSLLPVFSAGMLTLGNGLAFVSHDERENFRVLQYAPNDTESDGGARLIVKADFHMGCSAIQFSSHYCVPPSIAYSANTTISFASMKGTPLEAQAREMEETFGLCFGTTDGGFSCVVPLPTIIFTRLQALQNIMSNALSSPAACSARGWRNYRRYHMLVNEPVKKKVLDSDLLLRFMNLEQGVQEELCAAGGTTVDVIKDHLLLLSSYCAGAV